MHTLTLPSRMRTSSSTAVLNIGRDLFHTFMCLLVGTPLIQASVQRRGLLNASTGNLRQMSARGGGVSRTMPRLLRSGRRLKLRTQGARSWIQTLREQLRVGADIAILGLTRLMIQNQSPSVHKRGEEVHRPATGDMPLHQRRIPLPHPAMGVHNGQTGDSNATTATALSAASGTNWVAQYRASSAAEGLTSVHEMIHGKTPTSIPQDRGEARKGIRQPACRHKLASQM